MLKKASPLKHKEGRHMMLTEGAHEAEHKDDVVADELDLSPDLGEIVDAAYGRKKVAMPTKELTKEEKKADAVNRARKTATKAPLALEGTGGYLSRGGFAHHGSPSFFNRMQAMNIKGIEEGIKFELIDWHMTGEHGGFFTGYGFGFAGRAMAPSISAALAYGYLPKLQVARILQFWLSPDGPFGAAKSAVLSRTKFLNFLNVE